MCTFIITKLYIQINLILFEVQLFFSLDLLKYDAFYCKLHFLNFPILLFLCIFEPD